jgi:hypothetical protein
MNPNPTNAADEELRAKIIEIFGLEVPPNGNQYQNTWLLIRDENGKVLEGTDYGEEIDELMHLIQADRLRWLETVLPEKKILRNPAYKPQEDDVTKYGFNQALAEIRQRMEGA